MRYSRRHERRKEKKNSWPTECDSVGKAHPGWRGDPLGDIFRKRNDLREKGGQDHKIVAERGKVPTCPDLCDEKKKN